MQVLNEEYKEFIRLLIGRTNERQLLWKELRWDYYDYYRTEDYNGYSYTIERKNVAGYITVKVFLETGGIILEIIIPSVDKEDYTLVSTLFDLVHQIVKVVPSIIEITNSLKNLK